MFKLSVLRKYSSVITSRNIGIYICFLAGAATVQKYFTLGFNNYLIFTRSFEVLLSHQNLYIPHTQFYNDLFLYSPTFAALSGLLYFQPDLIGLFLWNLLNAVLFFFAVKAISRDEKQFVLILVLTNVELFISLQTNQSNPLVAALVLLTFAALEKRKIPGAAFFIAMLFFIKIYGAAALVFTLLYEEKFKFFKWFLFLFALLFILPLILIPASELAWQYQNWFDVLGRFKSGAELSVVGLIERLTGQSLSYMPVQIAGLLIFLAPLIYFRYFPNVNFRRKLLASLLIFLVIFNHAAELPTYIIAVTGAAIWFSDSRKTRADWILILLVIIITSLDSTSIFPGVWRHGPWAFYRLKVVPCLLVWLKIQYELHTHEFSSESQEENITSI